MHLDPFMQHKICLVTGATSGIGEVTARALAQQGATVIIVGRSASRSAATVQHIRETTGNPNVDYLLADLSSQTAIRQLADTFKSRYNHLHVLVNNAGAIFATRQTSADNSEMTLALNHLSYFLLTALLLDIIKASAPARIINVSSDAHRMVNAMDFDDLQGQCRYREWDAYSQSKLANILFTYELARRLEGTGVTVNALHPGVVATNFGANNGAPMNSRQSSLTPEQGAQTTIYLATSPEVENTTGNYYVRQKATRSSAASNDLAAAQRLWEISERLTGIGVP